MSKRWKMLDLTWEGRLSHPSKAPIPIVLTPFWNIDAREGFTFQVFTTDYYSIFYR